MSSTNAPPGGTRAAASGRPAVAGARRRRTGASTASASAQEPKQSQQERARSAMDAMSARETLRFYTDDAPGLKIGPTMVLVLSLSFIGFVVVLHIWGKVTGASSPAN
ncbi:Protein transport protein Sec61 subunit beta [Hondaea fermentalgiana]|uniref:Protein transport protein Sec61 subunit beta n=1 Tax=Hondaea fermentalgiana TaxID=2315210 RepID=A0A2R5GSW2_9STRA|nr:Protein transport protein Sec61 subunit beta [Hondaea fermentalgiana]|eukprot:GBG33930.1 Protein transport protein Sec61 subunit beta [Hondaea fermentalgiana]